MGIPKIRIAPLDHSFKIKAPFKESSTNNFIEGIKKKFGLDSDVFEKNIIESLQQPHINEGNNGRIYTLKGSDDILLKSNKFDKDASEVVNPIKNLGNGVLIPLEENPNKVIGMIGNIQLLKKIPDLNEKHTGFFKALNDFPQKSFDNFVELVRTNLQKGFAHDTLGEGNTLLDKSKQVIDTIDSFAFTGKNVDDKTFKSLESAVTDSFFKKTAVTTESLETAKKTLKALMGNAHTDCTAKPCNKLANELNIGKNGHFAVAQEELNYYKSEMAGKTIQEIKEGYLGDAFKDSVKSINEIIDSITPKSFLNS